MKINDTLLVNHVNIEAYCNHLSQNGRKNDTAQRYRNYLMALLEFLPPDGALTKERLLEWREKLIMEYPSTSTINVNISAINRFLDYVGRRDMQVERVQHKKTIASRELGRNEYLRLLQAAKLKNNERLYLIIKVFASVGLSIGELNVFTVDTLHTGRLRDEANGQEREIFIPPSLKNELLSYILRKGITQGPIFCTKNGTVVDRSNILCEIKTLCNDARVSPEKCNLRNLTRLYLSTREEINREMALLAERAYMRLLESEQTVYGWES